MNTHKTDWVMLLVLLLCGLGMYWASGTQFDVSVIMTRVPPGEEPAMTWPEEIPPDTVRLEQTFRAIKALKADGLKIRVIIRPDSTNQFRLSFRGPALVRDQIRIEEDQDTLSISLRDKVESPSEEWYQLQVETSRLPNYLDTQYGRIDVNRKDVPSISGDSLTLVMGNLSRLEFNGGDASTFDYMHLVARGPFNPIGHHQMIVQSSVRKLEVSYAGGDPPFKTGPTQGFVLMGDKLKADTAYVDWPHSSSCILQVSDYVEADMQGTGYLYLVNEQPSRKKITNKGKAHVLKAGYRLLDEGS